jgi:hypothetical protein
MAGLRNVQSNENLVILPHGSSPALRIASPRMSNPRRRGMGRATPFQDGHAVLPMMEEVGRFNDDTRAAGLFVMADGLSASSEGKCVAFDGRDRTVIDGPFTNPEELLVVFWIWEMKDMDRAVECVKLRPNPMPGPSEIDIMPILEWPDC